MIELIAIIILLLGLIGMSIIIVRKIPVLVDLAPEKIGGPGILRKIKDKVKSNGTLKSFSAEILLQKALSKIRVLSLRADRQTCDWLAKLRQNAIEKKKKFSEDYWKKIRKGK